MLLYLHYYGNGCSTCNGDASILNYLEMVFETEMLKGKLWFTVNGL